MSLKSLFDSIVAKSSEARKYYELGMLEESAQLCSIIHDDSRSCLQALRQQIELQNPESQAHSGESSIEGSINMGTPPQTFAGVKRKPSNVRPQINRNKSSRSSPPVAQRLTPLKTDSTTPPPASYYQSGFPTPQLQGQAPLARPDAILASQNLPQELNVVTSQGAPYLPSQQPQSPFVGYGNVQYPVFRSQPPTPYFSPNGFRMGSGQYFQSPAVDYGRSGSFQATNPMSLIDPRTNPNLQFRRPSEPTIPTHAQHLTHTPLPTPAAPTINLPGQAMSYPSPQPTNSSSTDSPFPPTMLPQLDALFVAFLQRVVSDESITDGRGEALHHPLPPRKQQKVHALPLTSWRPIKLRIQAFTSAFQEELAKTLAGQNLNRHEVSIKRVREYLWTRDLIARYNPSGRKAKSRGSHVWCVEARRRQDDPKSEWEFRPWKRKIQVVRDSLVAPWGHITRMPLKVWDPQVQYEDLEVTFSVRGQLPRWLTWESDYVLIGTPPAPANEEGYKVQINVSATYSCFGMSHVIEGRLDLDVRSPATGGDLAASLRNVGTIPSATMPPGMETGMETYLDDGDEDDEMMFVGTHNFSSETNTPPSGMATAIANPNQLLYVSNQSLQTSQLKQSPLGPASPTSGNPLGINPLTPALSPGSLGFNHHISAGTSQSNSAPHTPTIGNAPSNLSLQLPVQNDSPLSSAPPQNLRFSEQSLYGALPVHLSTPTSAESNNGTNRMYDIDEEMIDNNMGHAYIDDTYPLELGSPFLER